MRLHEFLGEDAQSDFAQHQQALHIIEQTCRFFSEDHSADDWRVHRLRANGQTHLAFHGTDLGWPEICAQSYFLLSPGNGRFHGNQGEMPDSGIPFVQIAGITDTDDVAAAVTEFVDSEQMRDTLLHELIHLLDAMRNRAMDTQRGKTTATYYNSPHEFNAFYHQLSAPMMHFLQAAQRPGATPETLRKLARSMRMDRSFVATLTGILDAAGNNHSIAEFMDFLDETHNKKLLKRLYLLHKEVCAYL